MRLRIGVLLACFTMITLACGSAGSTTGSPNIYLPPTTFAEADLVGTWQAEYSGGAEIDTLTINADGTFQQVFRTNQGDYYESPWNKWWVEKRPSGCIYLHLEGMRYYAADNEKAEDMARGNPASLIELCEMRVLKVTTELVLTVVGDPAPSRGILLAQMKPDADTSDEYFLFLGTSTPEPVP
jgi:hypothetical protein